MMNIYVDFDDCLCETARYFTGLVSDMFGKQVPYKDMHSFDLQQSFDLTAEQYEQLLTKGHEPEVLLSFEETPGAATVINEWSDAGHNVVIITGRPVSSYEPSRLWLDRHRLENVRLFCLDKYGREKSWNRCGYRDNKDLDDNTHRLELDDYYKMRFDFAVEDSPSAFKYFEHLPELQVIVFDRPWNRKYAFPGRNYLRCCDWESIRRMVADLL